MMTSKEVRQQFLDYFISNNHKIVQQSKLCLNNDYGTNLLFTNSGMCQFTNIFKGKEPYPDCPRLTNSQFCLRISGKHNDFKEVGRDTYHHTLFEMLGNWSFNDYGKEKSIDMAYDLLVHYFKLDPRKMYITYFGGEPSYNLSEDTETRDLWKKYFSDECIIPSSFKNNFWEMDEYGTCGPCTEIHYNRSDLFPVEQHLTHQEAINLVNKDDPRVIEIWNLVFTSFNKINTIDTTTGQFIDRYEPLEHMVVDTGMGFERLVSIVQKTNNNYQTDIFKPIIELLHTVTPDITENSPNANHNSNNNSNHNSNIEISKQIVADHFRACVFLWNENLNFNSYGSGYILRKLFRRGYYHLSHHIGISEFGQVIHIINSMIEYWQTIYPKNTLNSIDMSIITVNIENEIRVFGDIINKSTNIIQKIYKNIIHTFPLLLNSDTIMDNNHIQYIAQLLFKCQSTHGIPSELCHEILTYKFMPHLLLYNSQIDTHIDNEFRNHQQISRQKPIKL